jgi:hypothetical protein
MEREETKKRQMQINHTVCINGVYTVPGVKFSPHVTSKFHSARIIQGER